MYPPLTLKYIQALLNKKKKYEVRFFDYWVSKLSLSKFAEGIFKLSPDIVIIYVDPYNFHSVVKFISLITQKKKPIIIGIGPDITFRPELYIEDTPLFDIIIPGEPEIEILSIIEKLNGNISMFKALKDIYRRRVNLINIVFDLDNLPFPNFTLKELKSYTFIYPVRMNRRLICGYVITSRGCPYSCTFCSPGIRKSYSKVLRLRSTSNIVDEIQFLMKKGVNFISFEDDNFVADFDHVVSICEEIKRRRINIKWSAQVRVDEVNYKLLKLMRDSGCSLLQFGIESASKRILRMLNKTTEAEKWIERSKEIFYHAKKLGITTCALFMIGNPTETRQEAVETIKLAKCLNSDLVKVHFFILYPGSTIYEKCRIEYKKLQLQDDVHHYSKPIINLSNMSVEELLQVRKKFYRNVYLQLDYILKHIFKYGIFYIFNIKVFFILLKGLLRILQDSEK